LVWLLKDWV